MLARSLACANKCATTTSAVVASDIALEKLAACHSQIAMGDKVGQNVTVVTETWNIKSTQFLPPTDPISAGKEWEENEILDISK